MKTLILTSIYSNLWGTEFGGRASRGHHYRYSLLSILKMAPSKIVCFTSKEEIDDLKNFFYVTNNINPEILELKEFDLQNSKYFNVIRSKKNLVEMKNFDRCFEIQYNKFFWVDEIVDINNYDRVYWFDAGLSHSGLFPECFSYGEYHDKNFKFNLFNENYLNYLNEITSDKFILVCKNNTGPYYWSPSIPEKYYKNHNKDLHVIGGFFGGKKDDYLNVVNNFDSLLSKLLLNESNLYMEEQILSCILYNTEDFFFTLKFDDWYKKENNPSETKLFYEIFILNEDCYKNEIQHNPKIVEDQIHSETEFNAEIVKDQVYVDTEIKSEIGEQKCALILYCLLESELNQTINAVNSILGLKLFDIFLITDYVEYFTHIIDNKFRVLKYTEITTEEKLIVSFPNFHSVRHSIRFIKSMGYEIILYMNNNIIFYNLDETNFVNFSKKDFDICFISGVEPQIGFLRENYDHFQKIIDTEFENIYEEKFDSAPNPESNFFIVKNNAKLDVFLSFWDEVYNNNNNKYPTYFSGVYLGICSIKR